MLQRLLLILTLAIGQSALGAPAPTVTVKIVKNRNVTSLKIPESYDYFMEREREKQQIIPERAKDAKSEDQFLSTVLDHNFKTYLKENPDSSLNSIKEMEDSVNSGTSVESDSFSMKSKLNIAKGSAELNISYLLDSRIWFEDRFSSVNAELDFYSTEDTRFGIDYKSDREDTRTQLGFKFIW